MSSTSHMYCGVARVMILQRGGREGGLLTLTQILIASEDNLLTDDENSTKQEKFCF